MRGWGYVQERREWKSAVLWGNENRMWHDSKPDSLSLPSSPTTQSGFEVRFYLAPLTLTFLTQFCTTHCVTANSLSSLTDLLTYSEETRKSSRSHNHSIDCFLLWPFSPPNIKTKMTCAWLSESGIPFPDRRKHKRSVSVCCHPHPPLAHARTLAHLTPDFVSWVSFWWVA